MRACVGLAPWYEPPLGLPVTPAATVPPDFICGDVVEPTAAAPAAAPPPSPPAPAAAPTPAPAP
eukprot:623748-Prymnesium_polylepis.1